MWLRLTVVARYADMKQKKNQALEENKQLKLKLEEIPKLRTLLNSREAEIAVLKVIDFSHQLTACAHSQRKL